jgi:acyl-CoA reductase-like NAD-dependent aldehyde dehydrogenase
MSSGEERATIPDASASGWRSGATSLDEVAREVRGAMDRAREASGPWSGSSVEERAGVVLRLRDGIVANGRELADMLVTDTGKPTIEAWAHEIASVVDAATFFARRAPRVLAPEEIEPRFFKHRRSYVRRRARGVVAILAPACFPFYAPISTTLMALVAGNAVVLAPGGSGERLARTTAALFSSYGLPDGLFTVLEASREAGRALVEAEPDLVVFSGTTEAGREVARACGARLVPTLLSLGGNAPAIVCGDVDVSRAARALVYGSFAHGGQSCARVGRVYASRRVVDALVAEVHDQTSALRLRAADDPDADVTGILLASRREAARELVRDAVDKGAEVVCGVAPAREPRDGPEGLFAPVVLTRCDARMRVMREELLAPVMPIMAVESDDEAVALANGTRALVGHVFSSDEAHARRVAERLAMGTAVVNDAFTAFLTSELPFGGSRFGAVRGEEGLRQLCELAVVNEERPWLGKRALFRFPYEPRMLTATERALALLFGSSSKLRRVLDYL